MLPSIPRHRSPNHDQKWNFASPSTRGDRSNDYDALQDSHVKFVARETLHPRHLSPLTLEAGRKSHGPRAMEAMQRLRAQREHYVALLTQRTGQAISLRDGFTGAKSRQSEEEHVRPDEVFIRVREKLIFLWDELNVDIKLRAHFEATVFSEVTAENISLMHHEVERLVRVRALEKDLAQSIEQRESFIYLLQDLVEKASLCDDSKTEHKDVRAVNARGGTSNTPQAQLESESGSTTKRQLGQYLSHVRKCTFEVLSTISQWRESLGYEAIFLWRGTSYVIKMMSDLEFVAQCPTICNKVRFAIAANPLLDPRHTKGAVMRGRRDRRDDSDIDREREEFDSGMALATYSRPTTRQLGSRETRMTSAADDERRKITREMFDQAEDLLFKEATLWKQFVANAKQVRFDALEVASDEILLRAARRECMFNDEAIEQVQAGRARRTEHSERLRLISRVVTMQRAVRGMLARKRAKEQALRVSAAVAIQTQFRRLLAAKEVQTVRRKYVAATKIQALHRGRAVRSSVRARTAGILKHKKAVVIQCAWRVSRARTELAMRRRMHVLVTSIQSMVRGFLVRKGVCLDSPARTVAACKIQATWRGASLRHSKQADPKFVRAARKLQRWFRAKNALRFAARLKEVNRAATKIQALLRGAHVRQSLK